MQSCLGAEAIIFAFDVARWLPVVGLPAPDDAPAWQAALLVDVPQLHGDGIFLFANSSPLRGMYIAGPARREPGPGAMLLM
ncbi:MAG: hypothetical protein AB8H86_13540 [Polyangiales bacterium]